MWTPADITEDVAGEVAAIERRLSELLPDPPEMFQSVEDVRNLTEDQAEAIVDYTRRMLTFQLLSCEYHRHYGDDCGDYITAATDNWASIWQMGWGNDWQGFREKLILWLLDPTTIGGCDGEIRFSLFSEALMDELSS